MKAACYNHGMKFNVSHAVVLVYLLAAVPALAATVRPMEFESKVCQTLIPADRAGNAVCAPAGLAICFGALGDGIGGTRHADISQELGVTIDFASAFQLITHHYDDLNASNIVEFANATSFWSRNSAAIDPDFIRSLQRNFKGEVGPIMASVRPINAWTEAKTDGQIPDVVTNLDSSAPVVLVSASFFRGVWAHPFPRTATAPRTFRTADGGSVLLPTMADHRNLAVIRRPGFRATRLNYRGGHVSLWIILPDPDRTLRTFRTSITAETLAGLAASFAATNDPDVVRGPIDFTMPKFRLDTSYDILGDLKTFKVPISGYSHIGPDFTIGKAVHRAVIVVDETGPDAAHPMAAPAAEPVPADGTPFACDRPFLFLVREEDLGLTLLAGQFTGRD